MSNNTAQQNKKRDAVHLSLSTLAWGAIGASAFALLATGPRLLGATEYSSLALAWTIITIIGIGVVVPTKQVIGRAVKANEPKNNIIKIMKRLSIGCTLIAILLVVDYSTTHILLSGSYLWLLGVIVGVLGWVMVAYPRGVLVGQGKFTQYSTILGLESILRILLCGLAWIFPNVAPQFLAASMGIPMIIAGIYGMIILYYPNDMAVAITTLGKKTTTLFTEQISMTIVALGIQVVASTAPLWLATNAPAASIATVGMFVSATSYVRIPILFAGGIQAITLNKTTSYASSSKWKDIQQLTTKTLKNSTLISVAVTLILLAVSAPALAIFYGPGMQTTWLLLIVLGVSTVMLIANNIITQIGLASNKSTTFAKIWFTVAVITTIILAIFANTMLTAAIGTAIGMILAFIALAYVIYTKLDTKNTVPQT